MKLGICNEIFKDWDIEKMLVFVKELGYRGIEIAPFTFSDSVEDISEATRNNIRELAAKHDLEIIGTHWLLIKPEGLSVSTRDGKLRKKTADYLCRLVDFTSDIGGKIMVFGSPKQRNIAQGQTADEVKGYLKEVLHPVLETCRKKDIYLCLEPLARTETNFINTADEALEVIKEFNHPNLKLHLDVKAMSDEAKPIPEIIKDTRDYVGHFHVNDKNLGAPGSGQVDFKPIVEALKETGYDGWLSVEVFDFSPGGEAIARNSIEYLKTFF